VVGMQMRVDCLDQLEVELAHELQITVNSLQNRIDNERFATMPAGKKVRIRAGRAIEELTKDHGMTP
jgi:hypothetical protein